MNREFKKRYQKWNKERCSELLKYDKKKHLELLKNSEDLKQQGKILSDELRSKLQNYSIILIDHLNWETRDQYLELLDKFMEKKMDIFNFRIAFCERYESIEKVADVLKSNRVLLSPHENSLDFANLLEKISSYCEVYSGDPEPFRQRCEIGDIEFRASIEKIFLKMQKYFDK